MGVFISDTQFNIKQLFSVSNVFCIALGRFAGNAGSYKRLQAKGAKKSPDQVGASAAISYQLARRLSYT